jgi:hypothetical protein
MTTTIFLSLNIEIILLKIKEAVKIKQIPHYLNFILFLLSLYLTLVQTFNPEVWSGFADTKDYLRQSKLSPLSGEFYLTRPSENFYPRPLTVPLLYKVAGSRPETIIQMQKYFHCLSVFLLVSAIMLFISSAGIRILMMLAVYFLMSWWNILGWTTQILSESLSMSFLFFWLASFLWLSKRREKRILALHIVITLLFCFTRDSWIYILLCFYLMVLILVLFSDKSLLKYSLVMLVTGVVIFFVQGELSRIGQRTKLPLANSMVLRVMPDYRYYAWFKARGMPDGKKIRKYLSVLDVSKEDKRSDFYSLYSDPVYIPFLGWCAGEGSTRYIEFLTTHPSYTLLLREPPGKLNRIWAVNVDYVSKVNGYSVLAEKFFPFFTPVSIVISVILLMLIFLKRKDPGLLYPVILAVTFAINIFLLYNADTMEVERHLFITMVMVQFISIWAYSLILDECVRRIRKAL